MNTPVDRRIAAVLALVEQRLADPLTVATLAAAAGLSPSRFARLFRAELGVTPHEYLRARRLARARVLLERTFLTVTAIMALVGCHDPRHFARDFRREYGLAPREWRQRYGPHAPARPPPATALPAALTTPRDPPRGVLALVPRRT